MFLQGDLLKYIHKDKLLLSLYRLYCKYRQKIWGEKLGTLQL